MAEVTNDHACARDDEKPSEDGLEKIGVSEDEDTDEEKEDSCVEGEW
jgi:hypothetical protein